MMEGYSFYVQTDTGLREYDYADIVHSVLAGTIDPGEKVLMMGNLWRDKKYIKARDVLKF